MAGSSASDDDYDDNSILAISVGSLLGVKDSLRFRPHGSTQKAHIILRRVVGFDDEQQPRVVRFSFFAQKRIEVKPGKEILLAISTEDEQFKDIPLVFEGDLKDEPSPETATEEAPAVEMQELPVEVVPPKMRRGWTKRADNASLIQRPPEVEKTSIGIQATPDSHEASVQAIPDSHEASVHAIPDSHEASVQAIPSYSSVSVQQDPPVVSRGTSPVPIRYTPPTLSPVPLPPQESRPDPEEEMDISDSELSSMDLDSPRSSTSSSPVTSTFPPSVTNSSQTSVPEQSMSPVIKRDPSLNSLPSEHPLTVSQDDQSSVSSCSSPAYSPQSIRSPSPLPKDKNAHPLPETIESLPPPHSPTPSIPASAISGESRTGTEASSTHKSHPAKKSIMDMFVRAKLPTGPTDTLASIPLGVSKVITNEASTSEKRPVATSVEAKPMLPPPTKPSASPVILRPNAVASSSKTTLPVKPLPTGPKSMSSPIPSDPLQNPLGIRPSTMPSALRQCLSDKPPPSYPKALAMASTKKTVVVDGKWSASRASAATSSVNPANFSGLLTSSQTVKDGKRKSEPNKSGNLADLTKYGSPEPSSAPLPPSTPPPDPPPPSHPWPAPSRWKPVKLEPCVPKLLPPTPLFSYNPDFPNGNDPRDAFSSLPNKSPPSSHLTDTSTAIPLLGRNVNGLPSRPPTEPLKDRQAQRETLLGAPERIQNASRRPPPSRSASPADAQRNQPESTKQPSSNLSTSFKPIPLSQVPTAPLTHPLPPRPMALPGPPAHRGVKRERPPSPDSRERERSPEPKRRYRSAKWPVVQANPKYLQGDAEPSAHKINFSSKGDHFVLSCSDRTVRVWNNRSRAEIARLSHNAPVVDTFWLADDAGVITLTDDGLVHQWAKVGENQWKWSKVLDAGSDYRSEQDPVCFAYARDRIAVSFPRMGVKLWTWNRALSVWQAQRSILRQNVTAIKFIADGTALIGGTRDGALWYCEVPNGTLRAYAFLKSKIISLDTSPQGTHVLVGQNGGSAVLVAIRKSENKGNVEQVYVCKDGYVQPEVEFGALFATNAQAILLGAIENSVLVWDRKKAAIVYGLEHDQGDCIQAVAAFDGNGGNEGCMITVTRKGQLCWWALPVAAPQGQGDESQKKRLKQSD